MSSVAAASDSAALAVPLPTREDTVEFGRLVGSLLRSGDVVLLTGDLGAGKTTLTQGIGAGVGVRGPVTSPTFVIARVHPSLVGGPALVHVDAYRVGSTLDFDDLDLDAAVDESVTVVEWGTGLAESLAPERLEITLRRSADAADETRSAAVRAVGPGWERVLAALTPLASRGVRI